MFDFSTRPYRETHVSYFDGSPAMLVREREGMVRLVNEEGYVWSDPASHWILIGTERQEDYERWAYEEDEDEHYSQSGAEFMADYYNSDSYIAYLNRY